MKLRVTGLLLGILVLVAVMVPAFAAAVDRADDGEDEVSNVIEDSTKSLETEETVDTKITMSYVPAGNFSEVSLDSGETPETVETVKPVENVETVEEELIISDSPFFLDGVQMTDLVYQEIGSLYYVTVESFLLSMDPETVIEERKGVVTAEAFTLSEVVEVDGDLANVEEETLVFTAEKGECYVVANGRYLYVKNGVKTVEGKIAVPVSVLAKVFNLKVAEDEDIPRVDLTKKSGTGAYLKDGDSYYNKNTLYWLSRIIYSEAGTQSMKGKLAVGNVVMNRVNSSRFPNNIKDVLFQKNQFSPAMSGSIYREPGESSVIAAKLVMDGAVVLRNALFFNREGMDTYASRNRTYVTTIGNHSFYS